MLSPKYGVTVRNLKALRGPNLFAYMPVLQITMDIGPYEERPSNSFPGFVERITGWLPGLEKHECSLQRPGGFIERLKTGTYLGHISEHITLELQGLMGFEVAFGRARGTGEPGVYNVVIAYREEEPAKAAFDTALRMTLAAMNNEPFDVAAEIEQLIECAEKYSYGPSTASIVEAARSRKIPVIRLTPTQNLVQLGYGIRQKRIMASETSNTNAIAVEMCQEKTLTNNILRNVGVLVPDGQAVSSAEEAWEVAQEIGLPVVVKPESGNQGKGVSTNLTTEKEVRQAFEIAQGIDRGEVLVESFIEGQDYRLLVVNGEMVAASRRDPAQVVGDGVQTVEQLVHQVNQDPKRRPGHSSSLTRIRLDDTALLVLQQQNMTPQSVPQAGTTVRLRNNCNLSTGGTATDVTDDVHPTNARLAELAAQILDLDVAGIDVMCRDIRRPLAEQRGAIVEVNAAPGLRMHLQPAVGQPRDVGKPIVRMLYPDNAPSRIPIISVTGTNGKTTVTRLISFMFQTAHKVVGMTCTDGTYIGQERIMNGDCSGPRSARAVLLHPRVEAAVLETARGGILREGLAFDECSVGVVTNISSDHLGLNGINSLEQLARVKQVVIEAVARNGSAVLNADDALVSEMAAATDAQVIYFSSNPKNPVITAHLAEGGAAVLARQGWITLANGETETELVELERVSFTGGGKIGFQVQNALAATAAAWACGLNPALIVRALTTFKTDQTMVPGRFNVTNINGVEVVVDYGHNTAALKALGEAVQSLGPRRTTMVLGLPGDRRDEDLLKTAEVTLDYVNAYFLHDEADLRGRQPGEVPAILKTRLVESVPCEIVKDQPMAIKLAWQRLKPGERLVIIADKVEEVMTILQNVAVRSIEEAECLTPLSLTVEPVLKTSRGELNMQHNSSISFYHGG